MLQMQQGSTPQGFRRPADSHNRNKGVILRAHRDHAAQGVLFVKAPVGQDEDQLVQGRPPGARRGRAVARQVQHVPQRRQQLHHGPVRQRVVLARAGQAA